MSSGNGGGAGAFAEVIAAGVVAESVCASNDDVFENDGE